MAIPNVRALKLRVSVVGAFRHLWSEDANALAGGGGGP